MSDHQLNRPAPLALASRTFRYRAFPASQAKLRGQDPPDIPPACLCRRTGRAAELFDIDATTLYRLEGVSVLHQS
jgi:hypothetical protein